MTTDERPYGPSKTGPLVRSASMLACVVALAAPRAAAQALPVPAADTTSETQATPPEPPRLPPEPPRLPPEPPELPALPPLPPGGTPGAPELLPNDAYAEYARRYVGFVGIAGGSLGSYDRAWSTPYQGREQQRLLEEAEFYEVVERPDLAARFRRRRAVRVALEVSGGAIAGGGLMAGLSLMLATLGRTTNQCLDYNPADGRCITYAPDESGLWGGVGLLAGGVTLGVGLVLVGALLDAHPVDAAQARELADEHNRRLKRRLGLLGPEARRAPKFAIAPALIPGGAGASLALVF